MSVHVHKQFQMAAVVNQNPVQSAGVLGGLRMTAQQAPDIDQQLVERVQKGDKRAFDLLVIKYQHKVMAVISRLIRDHAEAQDVAQEAFIKAYRALPNFRGDSAFYTWIYRIAINTAKNHIVARNRRPPSSDLDVEEAEFYPGNDAIHEMNTPEHNLLRDELHSTIDQAFQDLPTDLRTAVTLREIEGLSYEEIAEVMECPVGTVRSRIFRAREAIDRRIKSLVEDI
jgi:RNA polymerase sigma-70 factor (ECF subfamily)